MQEALPRLAITISVALCVLFVGPPRAWAQSRTAPEATQHALDELTNAMAQGKITATPSPTATATPDPTATPPLPTSTSAPQAPAETPAAAPTPSEPPLPVPDSGASLAGYVRPSPRDPGGTWLELAVPQGRWAILYDTTLCAPPSTWTNVWLTRDDQSDLPITVDRDGNALCAVSAWSWTSDVPCAADDQGTCDVALDSAYWDALGQAAPVAVDTPPPTPAPEPRVEQTALPRVAAAAPPQAATPRVQIVVQTVVVVVTAEPPTQAPAQTLPPTSTPPLPTPSATRTASPTNVPTPTVQPTSTEAPVAAVDVAPTPAPTPAVQADALSEGLASWNWTLTFVIVGVALALVAIWLFVLRSGPVMW